MLLCKRTAVPQSATALAILIALTGQSAAQTAPFDFLNPGARSLALGSAFAGLADDATAGFTNPAGLLILRSPEFSFDARWKREEAQLLPGDRYTSFDPTYLSFSYPLGRWVLSAYRREFAAFEEQYAFTFLTGRTELSGSVYGGAAAVGIGSRLKLGAALSAYHVDSYQEANYTDPRIGSLTFTNADSTKVRFTIGSLITIVDRPRDVLKTVQVGVVYRDAPDFDLTESGDDAESSISFPDVLGIGLAIRVGEQTTIIGEVSRVTFGTQGTLGFTDPRVSEVFEYHGGLEYVFPTTWSPSLRVGTWRQDIETERLQHFTFGGGISPGARFELNVGADLSDRTKAVSVSAVVRVGR